GAVRPAAGRRWRRGGWESDMLTGGPVASPLEFLGGQGGQRRPTLREAGGVRAEQGLDAERVPLAAGIGGGLAGQDDRTALGVDRVEAAGDRVAAGGDYELLAAGQDGQAGVLM